LQSVTEDETQILSVPIRVRRAGREIRMLIDGTDRFVAAKPDGRLIKLLVRARRFNATLVPTCTVPWPHAAAAASRGFPEPVPGLKRAVSSDG
jgi:hypothetical protein